jgi:dTDP-4-dehydrorhamnose 3,5-epimerase
MIKGVKIIKKKQIFDERGKIMHMLSIKDKEFKKFGEIYFSCTYPRTVKAWHLHKKMTVNYSIILGKIKLVLFDDRVNSPTKGKIQEIFMSNESHSLVCVPPLIWNGFKSMENKTSIVANCSDIPHNEKEIVRRKYDDKYIPYNWKVKFK